MRLHKRSSWLPGLLAAIGAFGASAGFLPLPKDKVGQSGLVWGMAREWGLDLAEPGTEVTQDEYSNYAAICVPIYVLSESV